MADLEAAGVRPLADYAAVLSDLDGTLVDSGAAVARAWGAFAHRHAMDPATVIRLAQGRPAAETARELAPGAPEEPERLAEAELHDTEGIVALPGAATLLGDPQLTLAIVTSCFAELAVVRLRAAGLPVPDVVVSSDDVTRGKPDPEAFRLGARRLGADPAGCVVLEDAPAGIRAGRAAGMTVVAVRGEHDDAALADAGADLIVDAVSALRVR